MSSKLQKIEEIVLQLRDARNAVAVLEAQFKALVGNNRAKSKRQQRDEEPIKVAEPKPESVAARAGLPKGATATGMILKKLGALRPGEKFSFPEMAKTLYGNDGRESRNKISAKLNYLKKRGLIERTSSGDWKISTEDAA